METGLEMAASAPEVTQSTEMAQAGFVPDPPSAAAAGPVPAAVPSPSSATFAPAGGETPGVTLVQWEYRRVQLDVHLSGNEVDRVMNEMGWDGWELVGISNHTGSLKGNTKEGTATGSVTSAMHNATVAKINTDYANMVNQHPAMKRTIGIFKRLLTEERKQEILAGANAQGQPAPGQY
ncbi:MAG: hypothetical protein VX768_16640 [Planctomycetota bacterium]|nr:hypothetical protein [Planctomycetota bacterium]